MGRRPGVRGARSAAGFSVIELAIVTTILAVALLGLSRSMLGSMTLTGVNRESAVARDGAREAVERLQGVEDFETVFARFNADLADDPALGASPGPAFAVAGLDPVEGDPDGLVGEIVFPATEAGELREDLVLPELALPRDLNADGLVDTDDHAADYRLLPVLVRLRWEGRSGVRELEVRTLLADR
ncbi:MAG TPA: hypothetical protein VJP77_06305 [Planctomycetota bacterium]|nr:hypothetical protein [Planctomycetota bacterium]